MNKAKLRTYAPQARKDFIAAVTSRANQLGISDSAGQLDIAPSLRQGDVALIAGREWTAKVHEQRERLIRRIRKDGFSQTMDAVAYTWFNRFAALRYMEIHDYLDHGHRVLSSSEDALVPEVLLHAVDLARSQSLPGLNADQVEQMKLAGNQDGEIYRRLLIAQCNALSNSMPFLFERIDDETELLLPDNLLRTDSVITKLIKAIPEEDWQEVEIIGWLYQFYISEKKEQVMGSVVRSEDIPAATQLFTPNWVVQYLTQNSIGRLWQMANPMSELRKEWHYFIEPAPQGPLTNANLQQVVYEHIAADGGSLNPENITVLDPACGSGHILVEAYEILKGIYLERGYQPRSIPRLILEKNLFGLDIDDRAAQMAGFALLMKARADDRRIFSNSDAPPKLNVLSLRESKGIDLDELSSHLERFKIKRPTLVKLLNTFTQAKTFGSLIRIQPDLAAEIEYLKSSLDEALVSGDLYAEAAAQDALPLVEQAKILSRQYDAVIANPPYMGSKGMNSALKDHARSMFPDSKSDLFAMFIERGFEWCKPAGFNSMVTMQSWMFLSSYEQMREKLLNEHTLFSMSHMGNGVMGIAFGTAATIFLKRHVSDYVGSFSYCDSENICALGYPSIFPVPGKRLTTSKPDDFRYIPGSPIAYWSSQRLRDIFYTVPNLGKVAETKQGLATTNNALFLRLWHETDMSKIGFGIKSTDEALSSRKKWFPLNKGGSLRRWYGNNEFIINFEGNGKTICDYIDNTPGVNVKSNGRVINRDWYFKEGMTWSSLSSGGFSMRHSPAGFIFETKGAMCFPKKEADIPELLALFNSKLIDHFLLCLSPTVDYHEGPLKQVPTMITGSQQIIGNAKEAVAIAKADWDSYETSWDFKVLPFLRFGSGDSSIKSSWSAWSSFSAQQRERLRQIEEENNRLLIDTYKLDNELTPEVMANEITLSKAEREKDCQKLVSYIVGCIMGRFSLDQDGFIYALANNEGFNQELYNSFPSDADGIVPVTDLLWFDDEAAARVREFLGVVWGNTHIESNMEWLAEGLGKKSAETSEEVVRRYLADKFYKDHLQTYKRRPIYWLFSSGKQGAFQALVYLHRYHEGTLARMRSEYVVPLTGKIQTRIDMLKRDADAASSTAARNRLNKEIEGLAKKHVELLAYDEKLRHYADQRISIDLDDGVKVNYAKFGDLVAEAKAITGGSEE